MYNYERVGWEKEAVSVVYTYIAVREWYEVQYDTLCRSIFISSFKEQKKKKTLLSQMTKFFVLFFSQIYPEL